MKTALAFPDDDRPRRHRPPRPINPTHYRGLEATTLHSPDYKTVGKALERVVGIRGIAAVVGRPGVGKSHTFESHLVDLQRIAPVARFSLDSHSNQVVALRELVFQLTGTWFSGGDRVELLKEAKFLLGLQPWIVVLNEAQDTRREVLSLMRHLHDDWELQMTLLLEGGHRCWQNLHRDAHLHRRIDFPWQMRPQKRAWMLKNIRNFHPVLKDVPAETLARIYTSGCKGYFGHWANFVVNALALMDQKALPRLTDDVVEAIIQQRAGGPGPESDAADDDVEEES